MSDTFPQPWRQLPLVAARAVHGALTDIDDTLTTAGAITPSRQTHCRRWRICAQPACR